MPKMQGFPDEKSLTKGEIRKLNALRKSIGDELGREAFKKWYARRSKEENGSDPNIALIEEALNPLIKKVSIARGSAYAIRRGRGRFIIEAVDLKP
ncbi:MAG: hypothetical protein QNJ67_14325 [Kiloniellales bacterium]|nr:hypothetical protein [Kiloniellales bacterium]